VCSSDLLARRFRICDAVGKAMTVGSWLQTFELSADELHSLRLAVGADALLKGRLRAHIGCGRPGSIGRHQRLGEILNEAVEFDTHSPGLVWLTIKSAAAYQFGISW